MWKLSERSHRWLKWKATPMNSQHKSDKYKKMHHGVTDLIDSCAAQYSGGIIFTDIEYFHFLESTASSNLNPYNPETDDRGMVSYTNWVFLLYCDSKWNIFFIDPFCLGVGQRRLCASFLIVPFWLARARQPPLASTIPTWEKNPPTGGHTKREK